MRPLRPPLLRFILLPSSLILPLACSPSKPAGPTTRTSDAALRDPYGKWHSDINTDISGSGSQDLKRDVDNFLLK